MRLATALTAAAALGAGACGDHGGTRPVVSVTVLSDTVEVRGGQLEVLAGLHPLRVHLRRRSDGRTIVDQPRSGGVVWNPESASGSHPADARGARILPTGAEIELQAGKASGRARIEILRDNVVRLALEAGDPRPYAIETRWLSPSDETIYGLTERLRDSPLVNPGVIDIPVEEIRPVEAGSLDRRGETVEMFVRPTFALYAPFYLTSRGYGLYAQTTLPGWYDLASTDPGVISVRFETGPSPGGRQVVFFLIYGPHPARILDAYTAITGRPRVPPRWAFRHWRWRDELVSGQTAELDGVAVNAQVAEDVRMFEELGIPAGVYLLDRPVLAGNFGFARFAWDRDRLPNIGSMLASLRRRGYRVVMWSAAWACGDGPGDNGFEARRLGFLAPGPDGPPDCEQMAKGSFVLDVTQPEARRWFAGRLAAFVRAWDLDGIKLDRGEEHIPSGPADIWGDGRTGREVHNDYVRLQARMHRRALEQARPNGDWVLISRAGYAGAQRDTIAWSGDVAGSEGFGLGPGTDLGLRAAIVMQQRAAFLGYPIWGSDAGGYYPFKDREVFARWIEFSAFSGIMEIGGQGTHAPWDMPTEPRYDEELIAIYRRYACLRERLLDYIAAAAREAGATGMPLVRPMVFFDPDDPELADLWDEYLFGPGLLVAPVWRVGQRSREVYLPRGTWANFWNPEEVTRGPAWVTVDAPLDRIPVWGRLDASRSWPRVDSCH